MTVAAAPDMTSEGELTWLEIEARLMLKVAAAEGWPQHDTVVRLARATLALIAEHRRVLAAMGREP